MGLRIGSHQIKLKKGKKKTQTKKPHLCQPHSFGHYKATETMKLLHKPWAVPGTSLSVLSLPSPPDVIATSPQETQQPAG